ncbi:carboxylesterase [Cyathus striatus]|nr:carboxylesterase [Cyathus striatus]
MIRLNYLVSTILSLSFLPAVLSTSNNGLIVHPTVRQFLGVPYATAKRWQAPTTPPVRNATFQARNFGDTCVQQLSNLTITFLQLGGLGNDIIVPESENCLSVNIWAPAVSRKQRTAVMLWVYGGGFAWGSVKQVELLQWSIFVRDNDDVAIVSFNYRTNIFGQPNAPQLVSSTKSQNFGLLDLDAAVQWVYDNIAAFGGDPNRITLFGQSAGGSAVDLYTFAHPNDERVKEFNSSASAASALVPIVPLPLNETTWNTVANAVGCGYNATAAQLTCMQQVPFRTLEDAVLSTGVSFSPVIDGITAFSDVQARSQSGHFLHVPLLIGNTAQEFDIFLVSAELLANGTVVPGLTETLSDSMTQLAFNCPAGVAAVQRMNAGVPAWRYQYQGVFPDLSTLPELRAYHASDNPLIFATYNFSEIQAPATLNEIALSKYMQKVWVSFARNPNSGLLSFGWPTYNPNTVSLALFGNNSNQTGTIMTLASLVDRCGE